MCATAKASRSMSGNRTCQSQVRAAPPASHSPSPVLFLRGESDGLVDAKYMDAYAKLVKGSKVLTIPQAGHALQKRTARSLRQGRLDFLADRRPLHQRITPCKPAFQRNRLSLPAAERFLSFDPRVTAEQEL